MNNNTLNPFGYDDLINNAMNTLDPANIAQPVSIYPTTSLELAEDVAGSFEPIIEPPDFDITSYKDHYLASQQYEYLVEQIKDFEARLDDEHETAIQLASFGQSILMSVTEIGFQNPSLIYYYGFVDGKECQLIQNINQMNFLLMAVSKSDPEKPPRRIGFCSEEE